MHLSKASVTTFDMIVREDGLAELGDLTEAQKADLFRKLGIVQQVNAAGYGQKGAIVNAIARTQLVSKQAINTWLGLHKKHGFRGLIDGRKTEGEKRAELPPVTKQWIKSKILNAQRNDAVQEVHRQVIDQWNLWRRTGDPQWMIPGFVSPPADAGKGYPAGFSYENFRRCKPTKFQASLSRQGTIASYRMLPSILSTRVGSKYLSTIFFDDQKYDVQVRVPGYDRPMVPLGFNALDRLTAYPFRPHIRLRWYDADKATHRALTQKEFVWYVIFILCTEGYRTDEMGTTLVQEHGTAKTWSNKLLTTPGGFHSFEDALRSLTGVRMDDSGLFNKPAFGEMLYGPKSSGNPRFKAPIESFFHVVRTYMLPMIGQTGRNTDEAPEENYGIDQYERRMLKAAEKLPDRIKEAILSNYLTGVEFGSLAMLAYDALANRTDHAMEGWAKCDFVEPVWRWAEDPAGMWRSRSELAALPPHLREHALHQQKQDARLTSILNWSPAVARDHLRQDPDIRRLPFQDAIHLLPTSWAKPVRVTSRHEIKITEELLPGEELVYLPELTTPRGRTEFLQPGDQLMVYLNPLMPDTLLVCNQEFTFLGTLTRSITIGHDNNQIEAMYAQRARLKGGMEATVRRAKQPDANRRAAVRDLNADLIAQSRVDATKPKKQPSDKSAASFGRAVRAERTSAPSAPSTPSVPDDAEDWT